MSDHPFSEFLRILGKGPKTRRALTQAESQQALQMILNGEVTEKQLGAFLLLMRANGETTDELKGFVGGLRQFYKLDHNRADIDLDWAAYAGKWRYPPYFLLSIKLLVGNGYRVLLHGDSGQFENRQYAETFMGLLGFQQAKSLLDAQIALKQGQAVYLPLHTYAPQLREILHLKSELGVRTVFNTAVKLLNPLNAKASMQGIYHKGVENLHHAAATATGVESNLVFKGEGGEAEVRPDALTNLYFSNRQGETKKWLFQEQKFKAIIERQTRPKKWTKDALIGLWQGEVEDVYGQACVIATTAVALMLLKGLGQSQALRLAEEWWQNRHEGIAA